MTLGQDPTYPLFPVFAFLGFVVSLIPLPWHLEAWNAGTCLYMTWTALANLNAFINAVVWRHTALSVAPVWCDISSKFIIGVGVGIPASGLCIARRLYHITNIKTVSISRSDKRRAIIEDLCIGLGLPALVMCLHYIVQGHRFDVLEQIGCNPVIFNTAAAYPLVFMWPTVIGCVSFIYAGLSLRAFIKRRAEFTSMLSATSSITVHRYLRLMALAMTEMCCTLPVSAYSLYISTHGVILEPYISWANVHFNFSHVKEIPAVLWRSNSSEVVSVELSRWLLPACAFIFFALFGFAAEAKKHYGRALAFVIRPLSLSKTSLSSFSSSTATDSLPVYAPRPPACHKSSKYHSDTKFRLNLEKGQLPSWRQSQSSLGDSPTSCHTPFTPPPPHEDHTFNAVALKTHERESPANSAHDGWNRISISDYDDDLRRHITISEEYPAEGPPLDDLAFAAYHRPFSPPRTCAGSLPPPAEAVVIVGVERSQN